MTSFPAVPLPTLPIVDPYWLWSRPRLLPPLPSLPASPGRADVAIIGGGLAGLSAALHILRRHPTWRVVVLEAGTLGSGASARSTGMLSPGVGQSLPALVRRLGANTATALYTQTLTAVRDVCALIDEEHIACDLQLGGQLVYARSPAERKRLASLAALMARLGLGGAVEVLDDAACAARLRLALGSASRGPAALHFPTAGVLDPLRLIVGLCQRVQARGGQVHEGSRVLELASEAGDRAIRVRLADRELVAAQVVVATAGFSPQLGVLPGRLLPVQLQALVTAPLSDESLSQLGWAAQDGVLDARRLFNYFRLTADRRILFGGGRPRYGWHGSDGGAAPLERALGHLAIELGRVFPAALGVKAEGGWGGTIGYVLDALPAIGRLPDRPRIVHAVGWCGHGVALASACGAWIAQLIDGEPLPALPWFRSQVPRVPTELARYVGFAATTRMMALQDRWG